VVSGAYKPEAQERGEQILKKQMFLVLEYKEEPPARNNENSKFFFFILFNLYKGLKQTK
jgi:hypothetical protein